MSNYTEFTLFKECVNNPKFLDRNLSQLNLAFIRDPSVPTDTADAPMAPTSSANDSLEVSQRKANKLFYMVWSGLTKCLKN